MRERALAGKKEHGRGITQPRTLFEYNVFFQETGFSDGSKRGSYFWDAADGQRFLVTYEAGTEGRGFSAVRRKIAGSDSGAGKTDSAAAAANG